MAQLSAVRTLISDDKLNKDRATRAENFAAYAKITLCLALSDVDGAYLYMAEAMLAIEEVKISAPESAEAYLLSAYQAILNGKAADSPILRNTANQDAVTHYVTALSNFPENSEIVIAAAKAQTYLPEESLAGDLTWPSLLLPLKNDGTFGGLINQLSQHPLLGSEVATHVG